MKINRNVYNMITSEPLEVQELENGGKIEIHSLNQNENLYNEFAPKAKFAIWSSYDGKNYRLLLEDGYYDYKDMRMLYMTRVNQKWINFWDEVSEGRKKIMLRLFIPSVAVAFIAAILLMIFTKNLPTWAQYTIIGVVLVGFIATNMITNRLVDRLINNANVKAIDDIKAIVGKDRFDDIIKQQQEYYNLFFDVPAEDENGNPVEQEQSDENVVLEEKEEEKVIDVEANEVETKASENEQE